MNDDRENCKDEDNISDLETDYLHAVKSSTCLLLPTIPGTASQIFQHPLSDEMNDVQFVTDGSEEANMQISDAVGDSSSSADSNSVVQDPVSAQLINNISMLDYQTLSKNTDIVLRETQDYRLNGNINSNNRKLPGFVNWNWRVIRRVLLWIVLTALVACMGAIIAMIMTIPKVCNPDLPWHQGKVFYEVFPASFKDSNNDGFGDFKGLIKNLDYIQDLGVTAIRLNYIFEAEHYPGRYYNTTTLMKIDRSLGVLKDFQDLVAAVHDRNLSLILDIPVISMVPPILALTENITQDLLSNDTLLDPTSSAIAYWAEKQNIDGFYLRNLEEYVDEVNFPRSLQIWKQIIGNGKIFLASEEAFKISYGRSLNVLLSRIDLIDVHLDLNAGINGLRNQIDYIINGVLWTRPNYPWVHWNIGNVKSGRVANKHVNNTIALTALEFILPGTVSMFYGDEIGLGGLPQIGAEEDFHEYKQIHNLVPMQFATGEENKEILTWNAKSPLTPQYQYLKIIKLLAQFRSNTPTIYLNSIYKEGNMLKNVEIRKTKENLIVIERWYPRRNTCVFVGNFDKKSIKTDLSSMYYGGTVVAGTNISLVGQVIYFDEVTFPPNSAIILKLEK